MKYLLVLIVVMVAFWLWRQGRRAEMHGRDRPMPKAPPAVGPPQAMVRCSHCGLHLPATDAIAGPGGVYCSPAHRRAGPG